MISLLEYLKNSNNVIIINQIFLSKFNLTSEEIVKLFEGIDVLENIKYGSISNREKSDYSKTSYTSC